MVPVAGVMDFSAWFEVYLGERWYAFDARNNMPRMGRVLIARGRDADLVFLSADPFAPGASVRRVMVNGEFVFGPAGKFAIHVANPRLLQSRMIIPIVLQQMILNSTVNQNARQFSRRLGSLGQKN